MHHLSVVPTSGRIGQWNKFPVANITIGPTEAPTACMPRPDRKNGTAAHYQVFCHQKPQLCLGNGRSRYVRSRSEMVTRQRRPIGV